MSTPTTPKPRVIDPAILEMRKQHAANVAAHKAKQASADTLKRIIEKELPKLTAADKALLLKELQP